MSVFLYFVNYPPGNPTPVDEQIRFQTVSGAVAYAGPVLYNASGDYSAPPAWTTGQPNTSYGIAAVAYNDESETYSVVAAGVDQTTTGAVVASLSLPTFSNVTFNSVRLGATLDLP